MRYFPNADMSSRSHCVALLCVLALAAPLQAAVAQGCTNAVAGDLVGYEVLLEPITLKPDGKKTYVYPIEALPGCDLNGVSAQVCDTDAPEVDVTLNLTRVEVRRLGPRWHPIQLELVLYCDPFIGTDDGTNNIIPL